MEIYITNSKNESRRICTTNELDYTWANDFKLGHTHKYCGRRFLGECSGKDFGDGFKIQLDLTTPWYQFGLKDYLCLDHIRHTNDVSQTQESVSHGWGLPEENNATGIFTKFM